MKKMFLVAMLAMLFTASAAFAGQAYFVTIDGVITDSTHKFVLNSIQTAQNEGADIFVIKLNTPGGLLDATRRIVQTIFESRVPVAVYVSPQGARASSAGIFIMLAADYAIMSEGSNIGAAHPVDISGEDIEGDMREKTTNDTISFIRSIAEKRGRNVNEAELAVSESKSYTASEALNAGLIDAIAPSDDMLLQYLCTITGNESYTRTDIIPTFTEQLAFGLSNPNIMVLLFFIGIMMIFLELKMPSTFIFAAVGMISILLFLIGANFVPINLIGLIIILAGIALVITDVFVVSFGLLTIAGLAALVGGVRMLFDTANSQGVSVSIGLIIGIVATIVLVIAIIGRLILRDMKRKPAVGLESLVGKSGMVMQWNGNHGKVYVFGEIWDAEYRAELKADQPIRVTAVNNMKLTVEPYDVYEPYDAFTA